MKHVEGYIYSSTCFIRELKPSEIKAIRKNSLHSKLTLCVSKGIKFSKIYFRGSKDSYEMNLLQRQSKQYSECFRIEIRNSGMN